MLLNRNLNDTFRTLGEHAIEKSSHQPSFNLNKQTECPPLLAPRMVYIEYHTPQTVFLRTAVTDCDNAVPHMLISEALRCQWLLMQSLTMCSNKTFCVQGTCPSHALHPISTFVSISSGLISVTVARPRW